MSFAERVRIVAQWASSWFGRAGIRIGKTLQRRAENSSAFTIAFVTLAAKMAKADGVSLPVEEAAFERLFSVPAAHCPEVRRVWALATQSTAGYGIIADRMRRLLHDDPRLLRDVLECLFHVASADGILHPKEDGFIRDVAARFAIPDGEFEAIRSAFVFDPASPYAVLGVRPEASDAEIKARHRALVIEHHPDRMIARGVPAEFAAAAARTLAAINSAHDQILKLRSGRRASASEHVT